MIEKGKDNLSLYQFSTYVVMHYFYKNCKIYLYYQNRFYLSIYGVNLGCINEDIDLKDIEIKNLSMKNFFLIMGPKYV